MKECHIYDGLAVVDLLFHIEKVGFPVSEMEISDYVYRARSKQQNFKGLRYISNDKSVSHQ